MIYHSETGHTHVLAELLAEGAQGVKGIEVKLVSADEVDYVEAARADGYAVGSPDYFNYVAGSIKTFFDRILYDERFKGKPYVGFSSHAGGGDVLTCIDSLARTCGLRRVGPGIATPGRPDDDDAVKARQLGQALAEAAKEISAPKAGPRR
ncbi:MAG: hypothetical protein AMJ81_09105 [Phycisphaerae bacterium SM23_33]|nr:MAG: hypothetical protein AMJ81_09105 [Phycisphaerae bacterium SM23_33]